MGIVALDGSNELAPVHKHISDDSLELTIWAAERIYSQHLSLVNPHSCVAGSYPMRFKEAYKVSAVQKFDLKFTPKMTLTTKAEVCAAHYLRALTLRMHGSLPENLEKVAGSLRVDEETLIDHIYLTDLMKIGEVVIERSKKMPLLFDAENDRHWVGYMLPNGSNISFELSDLPQKFDPFKVIFEFELATYSTK